MTTKPTPSPKKPSFFDALTQLMDLHGMADWVVVAKAVDGQVKSTWIAGTGEGVVSDRERAGLLYFELAHMQASILQRFTPKA